MLREVIREKDMSVILGKDRRDSIPSKYIIVEGSVKTEESTQEFADEVAEMVRRGFVPLGGITAGNLEYAFQALYYPLQKEDD